MMSMNTQINALLQDNDYDSDFLKPTAYAIAETERLLLSLSATLQSQGQVSTAGNGDMRVEWVNGDKEVRLAVAASEERQSYIYYEDGASYQADRIVTVETLRQRLDWLEDDAKHLYLSPDEPCPLCDLFPELNPRLQASIDELESGGGMRFNTVEEMFAYLESCPDEDEDAAIVESGILPRLIEQALQEAPSADWRQHLNDL